MAGNRKNYGKQECTYLNDLHSSLLQGEANATGISKARILKELVKNHYENMPLDKRNDLILKGRSKP